MEGAAGESDGEEAPQEEVQTEEGAGYGWRRAYSLPPSLSYHSLEAQGEAKRGLDSDARLPVWRHRERQRRLKEKQRRQLEAAGVPAAEAMQPGTVRVARQGSD